MKKLKLVKQLDESGCGIACLAMVTGESYSNTRDIVFKNVDRSKPGDMPVDETGLECEEIMDLLTDQFKIQPRLIEFISLDRLTHHCVLTIIYKACDMKNHKNIYGSDPTLHAVVFDAINHCILDPENRITNLNGNKVVHVIELQPISSLRINPIQWISNLMKRIYKKLMKRENHVLDTETTE